MNKLLQESLHISRPSFIQPKVRSVGVSAMIGVESTRRGRSVYAHSRYTIAKPRVGEFVDNDVYESAISSEQCYHTQASVTFPAPMVRECLLGVRKVRQAFSIPP